MVEKQGSPEGLAESPPSRPPAGPDETFGHPSIPAENQPVGPPSSLPGPSGAPPQASHQAGSGVESGATPDQKSSPATWIAVLASAVAAIAIIAAVAMGVLWRGAASDAASLQAERAEAVRVENQKPDLAAVAESVFSSRSDWSGDTDAVTVTIEVFGMDQLELYMEELGFSPAAKQRMGQTRALDGTQQADGDHVNVTWTYHPDDGLTAIFEATN